MARIPRVAHFVYGFEADPQPFHLVHYLAIESCRQVVQPDAILFHCHRLPYGVYWDACRPHLTVVRAQPVAVVQHQPNDATPASFRYAHHADFVRLDALLEHGGIYADLDTLFLRPLPDALFDDSFVIGREGEFPDPVHGGGDSVCNALLLAEPSAPFAAAWRQRMTDAYDGSWTAHSNVLATALVAERSHDVRVEPPPSFYPAPPTAEGVRSLLEDDDLDTSASFSLHLWAHLWWARERRDFSAVHAAAVDRAYIAAARSTYARLARPFLPHLALW